MAKGKNSPALFEVINKGKGDLRTPSWWSSSPRGTRANTSASREPGKAAKPQFSYVIAGVSGVTVVLLLVIAFMLARSHGPQLSEHSTEDLMRGPANPSVMNIKRGEAGLTPAGGNETVQVATPAKVAPITDTKRTPGLNYVVVQSYPDEKSAIEAQTVLANAGIGTTIEKRLRGLNPSWYTVVGLQGFSHLKTPEYEEYVRRIEKASDSFAKKKSFKAFHPLAYKWG